MSREQSAGQNYSINTGNKSRKNVQHFKYLETTLANPNCITEEINSKMSSENACYNSTQNLSAGLLPNA
jgi:hypothetical protein